MNSTKKTNLGTILLCLAFTFAWTLAPFAAGLTANGTASPPDCPNGPLSADLSGSAVSGITPAGTARYRDKGSNRLLVNVRSVNVAANTTLDVYIGETKVGTITVGRGRSGQLRVDTPTATIDESTTITVRNGTTTLLTGTFVCVARGPKATPTGSPTVAPTMMPTASPSTSPTASPTMAPKTKPE